MSRRTHASLLNRTLCLMVASLFLSSGCSGYLDTSPSKKGKEGTKSDGTQGSENSASEDTQESFEPSKERIRFKVKKKLSDEDEDDLRLVIQPGLGLTNPGAGTGEALVDVPAKFKNRRMSVTIPPVDPKIDLGRGNFTLLLSTLYQDKDQSEDFSKGDIIIASAQDAPAYARPGNRPRAEEWSRYDHKTKKLIKIEGSIVLERMDQIETAEELTFKSRDLDIAKGINLLASISLIEQIDIKTNFDQTPRPFELALEKEDAKARYELTFQKPLHQKRFWKSPQPLIEGLGPLGIELLGGFKSEEPTMSEKSELVALGCIRHEEGRVRYEPVSALWIEPGDHWVQGPTGAFLALENGLRPGWNALKAIEPRPEQFVIAPLAPEQLDTVTFSRDCRFSARGHRAQVGYALQRPQIEVATTR